MSINEGERLGVTEILNEAAALIGSHVPTFLIATAIYAAFGVWADTQDWSWGEQVAILFAPVLLGGLLQYFVLCRALGDDGGRWFGGMLALLIAIALQFGIWLIAGLANLLLVVPGLYLAGRMSAAVGMVVVERAGLTASILGSWRRTRRSAWSLVSVHALLLVPLVALTAAIFVAWYVQYGVEQIGSAETEFALVTNFIFGIATMAGWAVTGAVYRLTRPDPGHEATFG